MRERFFQGSTQGFVMRLVTILLLDDVRRHLARTKPRHFDVLSDLAQALIDFLVEIGNDDRKVQAALKSARQLRGFGGGVGGVRFH